MKKLAKLKVYDTHCLNCGHTLQGEFCSSCGQKALLHKDSFWHLMIHFVSDYFHYDGKFVRTVKALFSQPGKITREYTSGKRSKYLNPIQLYLFVSAVFFFIFTKLIFFTTSASDNLQDLNKRMGYVRAKQDSIFQHAQYKPKSVGITVDYIGFTVNNKVFTRKQYDSIEASLPVESRQTGFIKKFNQKLLQINDETLDVEEISTVKYPNAISASLPKAFFVLLPIFALFLKLFFWRKPYADHIIFSLHYHTIVFIVMSIFLLLSNWFSFLESEYFLYLMVLLLLVYLAISLYNVAENKLSIFMLKFIALVMLYAVTLFGSFLLVFILSIFFM